MERHCTKWNTFQRILYLLVVCNCLCTCAGEDVDNQDGFCLSGKQSESDCSSSKDNKYKEESNTKTVSTNLPSELDLERVDFNDSKKIKDERIQQKTVELPNDIKTLQIPILDGIKVGHVQDVEIEPGVTRQIKTLSLHPPIFEIPDFLDPTECDLIIALADRKGMSTITSHMTKEGITFEDVDNTFKSWDYNGDGFIDPEEIILLPGKDALKFHVKDVLKMFKDLSMDKDSNDKLDIEEFKNTSLIKIQEYINERLSDVTQLRNVTKDQAWLWHDADELLRYQPEILGNFHERLEAITKIPKEIIQQSEPLQVHVYDENSCSTCGQDSEPNVGAIPCCRYGDTNQCRLCRFITVAYFLNDVEKGGEMVFPHANSKYEGDISNHPGNWSGFFTFAKTTGSKTTFNVQLTFKTEGANKILQGVGKDDSGDFEFVDSLVANDIVRFRKKYTDAKGDDMIIKYAGRVKNGVTVEGKWWVPGQARMNGRFFMYSTDYEKWLDREIQKCNSKAYCPDRSLVIKPQKGKAVMWYNHMTNDDHWVGAIDDKSYHGNCDVIVGEKWIAKNFINVMGDGNITLHAWKAGTNWLSTSNRNNYKELITKLTGEKPKQEDVIEEMFNKDMADSKLNPADERPPERHVLNAVTSLLEVLDQNGIREVSKKVHQKLQMTCIPLFMNQDGKIRVVDGSTDK